MAVSALTFVGCGKKDTNKELAKKIETESTDLIYSIETMDDVKLSDLADNAVEASALYTISGYVINTNDVPTVKTSAKADQKENTQTRMRGANPKKDLELKPATQTSNTTSASVSSKSSTKTSSSKTSDKLVKLSTSDFGDADEYSEDLVNKRAEIMLLCSKLRKGDIKLTNDELSRVNECITLVNETADYLEENKGKIDTDFKNAKTTASKVALREKLAIRQAKLQTGILAMDEIISIMKKDNSSSTTKTEATSTKAKTITNNANSVQTKSKTETKTNKTENASSTTKNTSKTNNTSTQTSNKASTNSNLNTTKTSTNDKNTNTNTTNSSTSDAVSILVQPVKTQNNTSATVKTTTNNQNKNEYIVRPRNLKYNHAKTPTFAATMPQPLPKATIMPYRASTQNAMYSI